MVGGETGLTCRARKAGLPSPAVIRESPIEEPASWGPPTMGANADVARGGELPRNTYAVFDSARRAAAGHTLDEARTLRRRSGPGTAVAAANPDLAVDAMSADEIRSPPRQPDGVVAVHEGDVCQQHRRPRWRPHPHDPRMGRGAGVPADHRVYLRDLVTAADSDTFLTRADVARVPGLDNAVAGLRERWGISPPLITSTSTAASPRWWPTPPRRWALTPDES